MDGRKERGKDESVNIIILTFCICQNPFTSTILSSHTCPLMAIKPKSSSIGWIRLTLTQRGKPAGSQPTSGLPGRVL